MMNVLRWTSQDGGLSTLYYLKYNDVTLAKLWMNETYCTADIIRLDWKVREDKLVPQYKNEFHIVKQTLEYDVIRFLNDLLHLRNNFDIDDGNIIEAANQFTMKACACGGIPQINTAYDMRIHVTCSKCHRHLSGKEAAPLIKEWNNPTCETTTKNRS